MEHLPNIYKMAVDLIPARAVRHEDSGDDLQEVRLVKGAEIGGAIPLLACPNVYAKPLASLRLIVVLALLLHQNRNVLDTNDAIA